MLKGPRLWFIRLPVWVFSGLLEGRTRLFDPGLSKLSLVCGVSPTFRFGTVPKPVPARLKRMLKRLQDSLNEQMQFESQLAECEDFTGAL